PPSLIYTLSLHDALPIFLDVPIRSISGRTLESVASANLQSKAQVNSGNVNQSVADGVHNELSRLMNAERVHDVGAMHGHRIRTRSEEHTSELQSLAYLVC